MVRPSAIAADGDWRATQRLFPLTPTAEGLVVLLRTKPLHSSRAPLQHMKHHPSRCHCCSSTHGRNLFQTASLRQYIRLSPYRRLM